MQWREIKIKQQTLWLHPFRAVFWVERRMLLLADLHLGKAQHFRRNGIPVPSDVGNSNWDRLIALLLDLQPERVVFLGDLFHSDYNRQWEELGGLISQFVDVSFELVPGNHDILPGSDYERINLKVQPEELLEGPFLLTHHPVEKDEAYNIAGHIHPCVFLRGNGRQKLRLPCFYFGKKYGLLPAFGAFTGMAKIGVEEGDQVFVVSDSEVLEVV